MHDKMPDCPETHPCPDDSDCPEAECNSACYWDDEFCRDDHITCLHHLVDALHVAPTPMCFDMTRKTIECCLECLDNCVKCSE